MIDPELHHLHTINAKQRFEIVICEYLSQSLPFKTAALVICSCIPIGKVSSYGRIARFLGEPNRARQVGSALKNMDEAQSDLLYALDIPWWRVLRADGTLPFPSHHPHGYLQRQQLQEEKIIIIDDKVAIKDYSWSPD